MKIPQLWAQSRFGRKNTTVVFTLQHNTTTTPPDERLNADLMYAIGSKVVVRTPNKLQATTCGNINVFANAIPTD